MVVGIWIQAMTVYSSANVILRNLTFRNSQQIHIEISCSTNVQVEALQIVAPEDSPNTDGIHVANSQHVVIQNSTIRTGCYSCEDEYSYLFSL